MWATGLHAIGATALVCAAAAAAETTSLPAPGAADWEPLTFRGVSRHTVYTPQPDGGVRAEAACAASGLVLPLARVDLARTPVLHWRWRIDRPLAIDDERSRSGDDFAARVYVMFRFEPERASLYARLRQRIGSRLYGSEVPGSAVSFVWTSREEPGAVWTNPFADETRMIAVARGGSGWRDEAVDVVAAYRRAFDRDPPAALALGIMTDSDNACQHAVARYAGFHFSGADA
jgi:hypothetical protein